MLFTTLTIRSAVVLALLCAFFASPVVALSSYQIGDTTYYSDGSSSYNIGDYTYYTDPNGRNGSMYDIGGTTYYSDNYGNRGSAYDIGGTTYFTDNRGNNISAYNIGDTTYYSDNRGNSGNAYRIGGTKYYNGTIFDDSDYKSPTPIVPLVPTNRNNHGGGEDLACPLHSYPDPDGTSCRCAYGYVASGSKCVRESKPLVTTSWESPARAEGAESVGVMEYDTESEFTVASVPTSPLQGYGVLGRSAPLRTCADEGCEIIRYYAETSEVKIIGEQGAWYLISGTKEPGGGGAKVNGWIQKSLFATTTVAASDENLGGGHLVVEADEDDTFVTRFLRSIKNIILGAASYFAKDDLCEGELTDSAYASRVYLTEGTIWAFRDDSRGKVYRTISPNSMAVHITEKQYCEAIFFKNIEEAEAAGYTSFD